MPNLAYFEELALNSLLDNEAKYARLLQKQLSEVLLTINGALKKIYDKWAVNGKLTKAEMTRYNKFSTMAKNITDRLDPAIKNNIKTIAKLLPEQYQESFFQHAWAIDNATGLRLTWGLVNTKTNLASFEITNPKNIELVEALHNYGPTAKKKIQAALLNGLSLGKSFKQMADDLDLAVKKIHSSAMTIIRTEGMRAISKGQNEVYLQAQNKGVEGKRVWSATKDWKTRADHRYMDGQSPDPDTGLYVLPGKETALYPHDPNLSAENSINCRCRERFEIDGYSPQLMRTREEGVIPYQNYYDYAKEYHPDWIKGRKT